MAGDATPDPSSAPIGRVRLDDATTGPSDVGASGHREESGWSLAGVGLAVLIIAVMIGALVIILWATFQTRA